ncbi:MAG TPA: VWA domain-containing protein [Methylomirabilota bacterium]|nr:VWA domain-containing protein [Methylomirabilota bacterium]
MSLLDNIIQVSPLLQGSTPLEQGADGCFTAEQNPLCADPEWAADHPSECPDAPTITGLVVVPTSTTTIVGNYAQFVAKLTFSDGREKDVTSKATWSSNLTGLASISVTGKAKGISAGIATITGRYRGYADTSQLTIQAACIQANMDVALVLDRSGSMREQLPDGQTRMAKTLAAAQAFLNNLDWLKDRVAVVSFSGIWNEDPALCYPDAKLEFPLWAGEDEVRAVVNAITLPSAEECEISGCGTGIGGGLQVAQEELNSGRARSGARKVIVLLTDGMENINNPDPEELAEEIKGDGWVIVVIALAVPSTYHAYLQGLCSCDFFFAASSVDELPNIYARIPALICQKQNDSCIGTYFPPSVAAGCHRDRLDYTEFANWSVTGYVDLIGRDLFVFFDPSEGPYVDLAGTNAGRGGMGMLESKDDFVLEPGLYEFSLKIAGNQRQSRDADVVALSVGSGDGRSASGKVFFKTVAVTDHKQPFTEYSYQFRVSSTTKGKIRIGQYSLGAQPNGLPSAQTVGSLVKDIALTNTDTGETIIEDDFSDEGSCP